MPVPVAVVGASGYTGAELLRLLLGHPEVEIAGLYARRAAGAKLGDVFPQFRGRLDLDIEAFDPDAVAARAEVAFCALPHGDSARAVAALHERGLTVLDLSADFRLRDTGVYARWYGREDGSSHPHPELVRHAVYGLPELYRDRLVGARLVAVPGCYPTAALLPIVPLLRAGLASSAGLIVDAKSGVTGAGRSPSPIAHFPEAGEGVRPYKVAGAHRHTPEMDQELSAAAGDAVSVLFTPHLLPMSRGILACVYAQPSAASVTEQNLREALAGAYEREPFITVLPPGKLPDTAHVRGSNRAHVTVALCPHSQRVLAMSAIDNLVKGASGQAIQCMNIARGWDERAGLDGVGVFP